jgi:hypothetical protein
VLIVERLLSEHHVRPQVNKKGGLAAWRVKRVTEYLLENSTGPDCLNKKSASISGTFARG